MIGIVRDFEWELGEILEVMSEWVTWSTDSDLFAMSAPRAGILKKVIVLLHTGPHGCTLLVNPEIIYKSEQTVNSLEGIGDQRSLVERPETILVQFQDCEGVSHIEAYKGFWSCCIQMELEHMGNY